MRLNEFQPTRPLRGATVNLVTADFKAMDFNPRAPCGARPDDPVVSARRDGFQPTRPLRGATTLKAQVLKGQKFQPTRPLRGATA